jgi:DNA-directed RNA polymerase subunit RPC12/RpoP
MREFKYDMKPAKCPRCGKEYGVLIPKDRTPIICDDCEKEIKGEKNVR